MNRPQARIPRHVGSADAHHGRTAANVNAAITAGLRERFPHAADGALRLAAIARAAVATRAAGALPRRQPPRVAAGAPRQHAANANADRRIREVFPGATDEALQFAAIARAAVAARAAGALRRAEAQAAGVARAAARAADGQCPACLREIDPNAVVFYQHANARSDAHFLCAECADRYKASRVGRNAGGMTPCPGCRAPSRVLLNDVRRRLNRLRERL